MFDKYGSCECFYGTAIRTADGGCACDNGDIGNGRDPLNGGVRAGIDDLKITVHRPLGEGGGIRMKPILLGQTNDYYTSVDPRIYQTGGASQTRTTPTTNSNTTGTTAPVINQLGAFYNQNKILVLASAAALVYLLAKKK